MKQHRYISEQGYVYVMKRDHPRATKDGHVFEHILVAEKALGKLLPDGAEIHHSNEVRDDNRSSNLVVCPNHSYHILLHRRLRAKKACGKPYYRICNFCKKYDNPKNLRFRNNGGGAGHSKCINEYQRERRQIRKKERGYG